MNKLFFGTIFILISHHATSQQKLTDNIRSTEQICFKLDTIETKSKYNATVRINWMDSIIELSYTTKIKYDLEEARKFRRDSTYIPSASDTITMNKMRTTGSQNCHSYALEKFFTSIQFENLVFTKWTSLKENKYMNSILATSFIKTKSFDTKRKKCKVCSFDKGSLIVFRNKWDTPIHTVYFDGQSFHSKYGALPAKEEKTIDEILKIYWDSTKIEEYQLDNGKLADFISRKKIKS